MTNDRNVTKTNTAPKFDRRTLIGGAAGVCLTELVAQIATGGFPARANPASGPAQKFHPGLVHERAKDLSAKPYVEHTVNLPAPFNNLSYDQYRDMRFRAERAIWRGDGSKHELQLFAAGHYFKTPVDIWVVENGQASRLKANNRDFSIGPLIDSEDPEAPFALSGFRVHGPINRPNYFDEYLVFQGASYFRAVAKSQFYGLSARGLAIKTARPEGEEFPAFRAFWIEKPAKDASELVIHALLDSPSVTGAYRFITRPGDETIMDVTATLFPRKGITHAGLAPLTSMFLHGPAHRRITGDFRPQVHDSEALAISNGRGERLWRPLTNPKTLQTSSFVDTDPKGFGLIQRDRKLAGYQDLEARYEGRPSIWVEPRGSWGEGAVELVEIPTAEEIHDNIAAFWKPSAPIKAGVPYQFAYRLRWLDQAPLPADTVQVLKTRIGKGPREETQLYVVDFAGARLAEFETHPKPAVTTRGGAVSNIVVHKFPQNDRLRVTFELATAGINLAELRMELKHDNQCISECWLYRWTRS